MAALGAAYHRSLPRDATGYGLEERTKRPLWLEPCAGKHGGYAHCFELSDSQLPRIGSVEGENVQTGRLMGALSAAVLVAVPLHVLRLHRRECGRYKSFIAAHDSWEIRWVLAQK